MEQQEKSGKKKRRVVIALGGNALGKSLPEQIQAVKITSKAIVDLIEEGCEVVVTHGNGPQVGMINNAMAALSRENPAQPNTPLSVCVAMSQAYIGYDLQNALREELLNRGITNISVATIITQSRVDADDPAFDDPTKPIGHFMTKEQAAFAEKNYGYIMKEDAGRGYRRVVASPMPREIIEIGAIRALVEAGQLVVACGGVGPGSSWRDDGVSWTPETALLAWSAAALGADGEAGLAAEADELLDWLVDRRTGVGALPEKVAADGSPAGPAPLAWTCSLLLLALCESDRGR